MGMSVFSTPCWGTFNDQVDIILPFLTTIRSIRSYKLLCSSPSLPSIHSFIKTSIQASPTWPELTRPGLTQSELTWPSHTYRGHRLNSFYSCLPTYPPQCGHFQIPKWAKIGLLGPPSHLFLSTQSLNVPLAGVQLSLSHFYVYVRNQLGLDLKLVHFT